MIYTENLRTALVEAFTNEATYSGWDAPYIARNLTNYVSVPLGTELDSDRDFNDMLADGTINEADLTPVENVMLSIDYFGIR
jgi:hypothetical protein